MPLRALVADDHPMCRGAARMALTAIVPDAVVIEVETLAAATMVAGPIDLIILDLNLPDSRGAATLIAMTRLQPEATILIISGSDGNQWAGAAATMGASGYVDKSAAIPEIIDALRAVLAGGTAFDARADAEVPTLRATHAAMLASLTPAEVRVLRAMSDGALNKQIAYSLGLSEVTVKHHVRAILHKLSVGNRTKAVLLYHEATQ